MKKLGLVLEGGGHRGIYSAGVVDVLRENNILTNGVIGVSAGAIHGASYVAGQIGRSIRYTEKYCADKRYMSIRSLVRTGDLFNEDFCYRQLPETLDPIDNAAFEASPIEYYVTCTDVQTGKAVYHRCASLNGNGMRWLQASASMPLASRVVEISGQLLLDGGVADSIPVEASEKLGFARNIVVLTQPTGYVKKPNPLQPLIRAAFRSYPQFVETSANRHLVYNAELVTVAQKQQAGSVFLIQPSQMVKTGRTEKNPLRIRAMYELGRRDAINCLPQLREFISND